MNQMSPDFLPCWRAAGNHLNKQVQGGIRSWLRAHPHPPVLEHLSFRLGNQLFLVRVQDADGRVSGPGSLRGLIAIADGCHGHACLLPMKRQFLDGTWVADRDGWGLVDAKTGVALDPVGLVTEQTIEMSDWELQDFAVQIVTAELEKEGYRLMSWQGNPHVDPAIWFVGASKQPEWVVCRAARYPHEHVDRPKNWAKIAANCARLSTVGHFAPVCFVSADQSFVEDRETPVPLWRGHGVHVRYEGLLSQAGDV